jgi:hypothetical protein
MFKYVVDQNLLQSMLDFISASTSTMPTMQVIALVDGIRALRPLSLDPLPPEPEALPETEQPPVVLPETPQ